MSTDIQKLQELANGGRLDLETVKQYIEKHDDIGQLSYGGYTYVYSTQDRELVLSMNIGNYLDDYAACFSFTKLNLFCNFYFFIVDGHVYMANNNWSLYKLTERAPNWVLFEKMPVGLDDLDSYLKKC